MAMYNKELDAVSNYFYNIQRKQTAHNMFEHFVERVSKNEVKQDGTDELLALIDKWVINNTTGSFHKTIKQGTKLYRARLIETSKIDKAITFVDDKILGFDESGSREAPLGYSAPGRNNIAGVSYLYLANTPETACSEIKPIVRQLISLAEFEIKEPLHIIDFSSEKAFLETEDSIDLGVLFTDIMMSYFKPVNNPNEYKATQVLTDYLRKSGIDGISYRSHYEQKGINYTIFNSHRNNITFENSRVLLLQSERRTFLDFNNERIINANTIGGAQYDEKATKEMILKLKKNVKGDYHINTINEEKE